MSSVRRLDFEEIKPGSPCHSSAIKAGLPRCRPRPSPRARRTVSWCLIETWRGLTKLISSRNISSTSTDSRPGAVSHHCTPFAFVFRLCEAVVSCLALRLLAMTSNTVSRNARRQRSSRRSSSNEASGQLVS